MTEATSHFTGARTASMTCSPAEVLLLVQVCFLHLNISHMSSDTGETPAATAGRKCSGSLLLTMEAVTDSLHGLGPS